MTTNYLPYELLRAQSWTSTSFDSFTSQGPYGFTVDSDGTGGGTAKITMPTYVTKGLQYRLTFVSTINSGSGSITIKLTDASGIAISDSKTFSSSGSKTFLLTATKSAVSGYIEISNPESSTINYSLSGIRLVHAFNTGPKAANLRAVVAAIDSVSPFTNKMQRFISRGQSWELELEFPPMPREYAKLWLNWITDNNLGGDFFYYRPILESMPKGSINTSFNRVISTSTAINTATADADYDSVTGATSTGFTADSDGSDDGGSTYQYAGFPLLEVLEDRAVYSVDYTLAINSGSGTITPGLYSSSSATVLETNSNGEGTARTTASSFSDTITVSGTIGAYPYLLFKTAATDTINFTVSSVSITRVADHFITDGAQDTQSTALYLTGPASEDEVLSPGDYIESNGQLFRVRQGDLDTNTAGDFTPYIWPHIRSQIPDDTDVYYQGPRGKFILEDSSFSWSQTAKGLIDGFKIIAREYF